MSKSSVTVSGTQDLTADLHHAGDMGSFIPWMGGGCISPALAPSPGCDQRQEQRGLEERTCAFSVRAGCSAQLLGMWSAIAAKDTGQ